jgi:hypothetical protein
MNIGVRIKAGNDRRGDNGREGKEQEEEEWMKKGGRERRGDIIFMRQWGRRVDGEGNGKGQWGRWRKRKERKWDMGSKVERKGQWKRPWVEKGGRERPGYKAMGLQRGRERIGKDGSGREGWNTRGKGR